MSGIIGFLGIAFSLGACDGSTTALLASQPHHSKRESSCDVILFTRQRHLCDAGFRRDALVSEDTRSACSYLRVSYLKRYESCATAALRSQGKAGAADLVGHLEYFARVLTRNHREMCLAELEPSATEFGKRPQVLRAVISGYDPNEPDLRRGCDVYNNTAEFFACGLRFTEIVSDNPPKEKLCMLDYETWPEIRAKFLMDMDRAYLNFDSCATSMRCRGISTEFNTHSMHVRSVVLSPYEPYCSGFVPPEVHEKIDVITLLPGEEDTGQPAPKPPPQPPQPPRLTPVIVPTSTQMPTVPPRCNEDTYLEQFFKCGLKFVMNLAGDPKNECHACSVIAEHEACVRAINKDTHCSDEEISIKATLNYIDSELRSAPRVKCPKDNCKHRGGRIRFRSSYQQCELREYAGMYFECGTLFLKRTSPNHVSTEDRCRLYKDFLACIGILVPCRSPSDIEANLNHFTVVLTEGYEDLCEGHNDTRPCTKLRLLKDFFYCGMHFYQSSHQAGLWFRFAQAGICEFLLNFQSCIINASIGCEEFSELISKTRAVFTFMADKHGATCKFQSVPTGLKYKRRLVRLDWQTLCDRKRAVRSLVLCGVSFDRMLRSSADNGSWHALALRQDKLCPLVQEMSLCMRSAAEETGCSDSASVNAQISVVKKTLLMEFQNACNVSPKNKLSGLYSKACRLRDFTHDWDKCDSAMSDYAAPFYQNGSWLATTALNRPEKNRLCLELAGHRKCLIDSADKRHCSELAPQAASISSSLFDRLRFAYCSGCGRSDRRDLLVVALTTSLLLSRLIAYPSILDSGVP